MMRHFGIYPRLIIAALILISSSALAFFAGMNMISRFTKARYEERIEFMAQYLSLNSELGILIGDQAMLAGLAGNLLTQQDIIRVVISDSHQEKLADERADSYSRLASQQNFFHASAPVKIKTTRGESNTFSWENAAKQNNTIGQVEIYYTANEINSLLKEIRHRFFLLYGALGSVLLVMFILLSHYLVKPIRQLVSAARQVAGGDLALRVAPGSLPETRELAEAFNAMLDSLSKTNSALEKAGREMIRQKTLAELGKFSLMIAHEIKNPLGIIKSSLDILKQDFSLSSENTMVSFIEDEIRRMNKMIEDFLEFARPTSPNFRETDIIMLIRDCVLRFELQTRGLTADFQLDLPDKPVILNIDPDLFTRVFSNIIKNALQITRGTGKIKIRTENNADTWKCFICDQGPGISPDDTGKIFEPFFTTRTTGTGLGLAYVFQVIKAHNGEISAENMENGGACFCISLPGE